MKTKKILKKLKKIRKEGCKFALLETRAATAISKKKYVFRYAIYHRSKSGSLWDPISMVSNWTDPELWVYGEFAKRELAMSDKDHSIFQSACTESDPFDAGLRADILKALKLKEMPKQERKKHRICKKNRKRK